MPLTLGSIDIMFRNGTLLCAKLKHGKQKVTGHVQSLHLQIIRLQLAFTPRRSDFVHAGIGDQLSKVFI